MKEQKKEPFSLPVKRLHPDAKLPARATSGSAGYDLCARLDEELTLCPGDRAVIPTGIAVAAPEGYGVFLFARSGLGVKRGITLSNGVGVVDSDYRGEIQIGVVHLGDEPYTIMPGERIAQMVLLPVFLPAIVEEEALSDTDRASGGFGSSGRI